MQFLLFVFPLGCRKWICLISSVRLRSILKTVFKRYCWRNRLSGLWITCSSLDKHDSDILRDSEVLLYSRRSTQRITGRKGLSKREKLATPDPPPPPFFCLCFSYWPFYVVVYIQRMVSTRSRTRTRTRTVMTFWLHPFLWELALIISYKICGFAYPLPPVNT